MAKLPALVSALAEVDGRDRATLDHIARVIREAGYIPTTKRGSGAAEMTAREAVNLLLAANGADVPKDGPIAIDRFRSLRLKFANPRETSLPTFQSIAEAPTFGDALEALVEGIPEVLIAGLGFIEQGYTEEKVRRAFQKGLAMHSWDHIFALHVTLRRYTAEIECKTWVGTSVQDAYWRNEFSAHFQVDADRFMEGFYGGGRADRTVSVSFSGQTILKLWMALNAQAEAPEPGE